MASHRVMQDAHELNKQDDINTRLYDECVRNLRLRAAYELAQNGLKTSFRIPSEMHACVSSVKDYGMIAWQNNIEVEDYIKGQMKTIEREGHITTMSNKTAEFSKLVGLSVRQEPDGDYTISK